MDSIRIKNIRSIVDSGDIHLSSINILLGKNSSGKSSFLRLFPMLKESARNELRGPILWFDENYDFGSFSNTFSRHAQTGEDEMALSFTWKHVSDRRTSRLFYSSVAFIESNLDEAERISVNINIGKQRDEIILKSIDIDIDDLHVNVKQQDAGNLYDMVVNDRAIKIYKFDWNYGSTSLLPKIQIISNKSIYDNLIHSIQELYGIDPMQLHSFYSTPQIKKLNENAVWEYVETVLLKSKRKKNVKKKDVECSDRIVESVYLMYVNAILHFVDEDLTNYFRHTYYITPLRYNFLRYMRNRDLAVDYIESTGKNVMEYILSLKKTERENYIAYIKKTLKVNVDVEGKDNKSIFITTDDGERDNIVDVGYGFSQVLPIATTLWDRAYKKGENDMENTIVIEQPEVHLHPAMQKRLAILLVEAQKIASDRGKRLILIVETHSQHLVNQLGKYVANSTAPEVKELLDFYRTDKEIDAKIAPEDIAIYLFNKKDGVTTITETKFGKDGMIENWPLGFLD